jgi:Transcriptional regulatory protein, C terminal
VLEALLLGSPAYLSATDLLRSVWDENADPFIKTLQVTIGRLQRKLGEPEVIETTPGVGYPNHVALAIRTGRVESDWLGELGLRLGYQVRTSLIAASVHSIPALRARTPASTVRRLARSDGVLGGGSAARPSRIASRRR